jgi:hypothetical protein
MSAISGLVKRFRWGAPARTNPQRLWENVVGAAEGCVGSSCFNPWIEPKFSLSKQEPIFAIGSCFASEIQRILKERDHDFVTSPKTPYAKGMFDEQVEGVATDAPANFLFRYNPGSMLLEIKNIFGITSAIQEGALLYDLGQFVRDCHYAPYMTATSLQAALARRKYIKEEFSKINKCRTVVATLGLTETWIDQESDLVLNEKPPGDVLKSFPEGRFVPKLFTHTEIVETLRTMVAIFRSIVPDMRFILTVSPIPLAGTFSVASVAVATTRSKGTLISAAHEVALNDSLIDYFPSYEMAMLSNRADVWRADGRHIQAAFVSRIVDHFARTYIT